MRGRVIDFSGQLRPVAGGFTAGDQYLSVLQQRRSHACPRRNHVRRIPELAVCGSYSSAVEFRPLTPQPPTIFTWPSGSSVSVCPLRASFTSPVDENVFVSG